MPVGALDIYDDLLEYIEVNTSLEDNKNVYEMTPEQVMKVIDAIAK